MLGHNDLALPWFFGIFFIIIFIPVQENNDIGILLDAALILSGRKASAGDPFSVPVLGKAGTAPDRAVQLSGKEF